MPKSKKDISFEKGLERLEEIVGKLEADSMSLENALELFEEGVKLADDCSKRLDQADKKIRLLMKDREKGLISQPFAPEEDNDN